MNTLLACVILTFIIIHLKNIKGNGQMGCMRSPNDVSIQKGKRNHNGTVLTSIQGLEIQMCINICLKMTGCGSVNFDPKQWRCELMKAINDTGDIDVQYVVGSQSVTLLTVPSVARNNLCGQCEDGQICERTTHGHHMCVYYVPPCPETYYLVTGAHGVSRDRVTWSSAYPGMHHTLYQLNSWLGWAVLYNDKDQWIKVNFTQRRNVEAIITQDRDGLLQWVTSYHVQYYDDVSSTWRYVTDDNVEIMVMMSLLLIFSKIPKEMFDMKSMQ